MSNINEKICPLCELTSSVAEKYCPVTQRDICYDCDDLIGLGFSNYDDQPPSHFYPATWVYDRIKELTGLSYQEAKKLWLEDR